MTKPEKELIELKFKGVYEHQEANFSMLHNKLDLIHKETIKTNGRVNKLEVDLNIIRFFATHPKIFIVTALGIFAMFRYDLIYTFVKGLF